MNYHDLTRLARFFRALASESRLRILYEIISDPKCAQDVAACIGKDVSTAWRHIKVLEDAGIVTSRREGRKIIVYVNDVDAVRRILELAEKTLSAEKPTPGIIK
ncbi:MAG: ArsR family transcriptional regulator, arsenate/arsenite/antimonite-responsive transcriptional [Candidatus Diapherotrites archaeon]|nr:ArsR family transcriptional regulator, arsenate/arsenite/antimonite-responsive transcriptional [Candidatus Diapherotrites archaeon]MDN5366973.1 ArsR family transcriptional regulator, arsenate/arsenite/antimonite-responsive transcriptional [Candidatus Diapherotrites archaeon]